MMDGDFFSGWAAFRPLWVLLLSVGLIVFLIIRLRVPAFYALLAAAILVGVLSPGLPGEPERSHWVQAFWVPLVELGKLAKAIGIVILLASMIGVCLMESGAADKIVRRSLAWIGEERAGIALMASAFVIGVPVFFDTVFFLMIPLARALSLRSGKDYTLYVLAISGGAVITHSLVAPTPGPLSMAVSLELDLAATIGVGLLAGLLPAIAGYRLARWINRHWQIPLRETGGMSFDNLRAIAAKKEEELPGFLISILPVVLPVILITAASLARLQADETGLVESRGFLSGVIAWLGNKNVALSLGTLIALATLIRQRKPSWRQLRRRLTPALKTGLIIVLITSAGGAFGAMLRHSGIGELMQGAAENGLIPYLLMAWLLAAMMKTAQGSGTVAMITTSSMMAAMVDQGAVLGFHPIYLFVAIGFGSLTVSWMNDSGFWVVGRLSGMTEGETLRSWTILLVTISVVGLVQVILLAWLFPFAPASNPAELPPI